MKRWPGALVLTCLLAAASPARTAEEIQVFNGNLAGIGQFVYTQHGNFTFDGRRVPDFPGGFIAHHGFIANSELAIGLTPWWEIGFHAPFAREESGAVHSTGLKVRHLFAVPDAQNREFIYGVNVEFSRNTPQFAETPWTIGFRPFIGWRKNDWEFFVNPIVEVGLGPGGEADFMPAARIAKAITKEFALGVEYHSAWGPLAHLPGVNDQSHQLFAVTNFTVSGFAVEAGLGVGLTGGSDRWVGKLIVARELNEATPQQPVTPIRTLPRR